MIREKELTFVVHPALLVYRSVVFRWLRDERGGKRFSHTWLGVWARVCGGSRVM